MSKQQARIMGFALVLSFAALRAMAGVTTANTSSVESFSPLASAFTSSFR
jgi:hypothetical protein